jgi:MFS family permease
MDSEPPSSKPPSSIKDRLATITKPHRTFYGWRIVGAAFFAQILQTAIFNVGAATLFLPIAREFGATRTVISGVFAVSRLEGGVTGPLEGYLIHWVGARRYMIIGWIIFGIGIFSIGLSQNIVHFYITFLVATLGQSMAGFLPIVTVLINWFSKSRGRAIAIFQIGSSVGALFVPLIAWSVLNIGWRPTTMFLGVLVIVLGVPLAAMMRNRPEDYGLLPDGVDPNKADQTVDKDLSDQENSNTILQALQDRNFWLIGITHASSLLTWGALRVHQIPAFVDIGLSEQGAAGIFSLMLVVAALGRLLGGFLGDFIGTRRMLIFSILIQAGAMACLTLASTTLHLILIATIFGIGFGARGTLLTVLRGDVFGRQNFSRLSGLMDPITTVGIALAPLFAGYVYDSRGSYDSAFLILAVLSTIGAFALVGIRLPKR